MINREATIRWKGYDPNELGRRSGKRVWANCDVCGDGRWVSKDQYRDLCRSCSHIGLIFTDLHKKRIGDGKLGDKNPMYNIGELHPMKILENRQRVSAGRQGISFDDWCGYAVKNDRDYLVPDYACVRLNDRFKGSEGHHITKSIVAYIPTELHMHIRHNIKTGENMGEMNVLAIQFINGGL